MKQVLGVDIDQADEKPLNNLDCFRIVHSERHDRTNQIVKRGRWSATATSVSGEMHDYGNSNVVGRADHRDG